MRPTGTTGQGRRTVLLPNSYSISPISNALSLSTGTEARQAPSGGRQRIKLYGFASYWLLEGQQDLQGQGSGPAGQWVGAEWMQRAPFCPLGTGRGSMVAQVSADPLAVSLLLLQEAICLWSQERCRRMSQCRSPRQEETFLSSFPHRQLAITLPPAGVTT